ncbi:MAG: hypothetical protein LH615_12000, partial [Ferruginibacter sp.]|nr:hypothetical protein [Ferruginibacter sp.]
VVRAYYLLMYKGEKGQTYNVCSGKGYVLKNIISIFSTIIGQEIIHAVDEKNFRPSENKIIVGSYEKVKNVCGWIPEYDMEKSLKDIINYWESEL